VCARGVSMRVCTDMRAYMHVAAHMHLGRVVAMHTANPANEIKQYNISRWWQPTSYQASRTSLAPSHQKLRCNSLHHDKMLHPASETVPVPLCPRSRTRVAVAQPAETHKRSERSVARVRIVWQQAAVHWRVKAKHRHTLS
jgi:hypothetical protein